MATEAMFGGQIDYQLDGATLITVPSHSAFPMPASSTGFHAIQSTNTAYHKPADPES